MKNLLYNIKKLYDYNKLLLKDKDWDWQFLIALIHLKLKRMENYHRKYGTSVNSDKIADTIKITKILADRLHNKDYTSNSLEFFERKYGENYSKYEFTPIIRKNITFYRTVKVKTDSNMTDKEFERAKKEESNCFDHSEYMRKQDIEYLFNYMKKYLTKWWD